MFSFTLALLLGPINVGEIDNVYSRSVPCCGLVAFEGEKKREAGETKAPPTGKEIAAQALDARFNTRLATTSKKGKVSLTLTPASFPENTNVGNIARGMVVGEIQTQGIHGLPDGKSSIYVALVDGKHYAYFVHEGKIVNKSLALVEKRDNKVESASATLTAEPGEVSPVWICGRRWCVEIKIKIKRKGT